MTAARLLAMLATGALIAAACGDAAAPTTGPTTAPPAVPATVTAPAATGTAPTTSSPPPPSLAPPTTAPGPTTPDVDLTIAAVPISEVYFDTFDGLALRLDQSTAAQRIGLRDAIPPIDRPVYGRAEAGVWPAPSELVVGYATDSGAYAYPVKILNFHEIVSDVIDGVPVLVSYCPLCRSAVVFDRRVDGEELTFGNTSALYESDLVMFDRETGSYWWQVAGRAIVGTLTGSELTPLPSTTTTWAAWQERHPDTVVLSRDTGFLRDYTRDPFVGYADRVNAGGFPFPVSDAVRDGRLLPAQVVLGVELGGRQRVYPLGTDGVINDDVAGTPVVVFLDAAGSAGTAYVPQVEGIRLTFAATDDGIVDSQTGSRWDATGTALDGALAGTRLEPIPGRTTFWFAYVGAFPEATVYTP